MNVDFFAPFDWSAGVMMDFGIFLKELKGGTLIIDAFVSLLIITFLIPYIFKILKKNPLKKFITFLNKKNNDIAIMTLSCLVILTTVAMKENGFYGLMPFCSLGGLTVVVSLVFI